MKIAVIGTGRVGLVTAVTLARVGHRVVGIDVDAERVAELAAGRPSFREPELDRLLAESLADRSCEFATSFDVAAEADVAFICVGRPLREGWDRSSSAVEAAGRALAPTLRDGAVVAQKSTVPPGTAHLLARTLRLEAPGRDVSVVATPEFLREGHAVEDSLRPSRIVVGHDDDRGLSALREVYAPMVRAGVPFLPTAIPSAELAKLASNAFLATKVSFTNLIASIAERNGADVTDVMDVLGADPRIGPEFLEAGLGYGGYCLPKDVEGLRRHADGLGVEAGLLAAVQGVNDRMRDEVAEKVEAVVWNLEGKRIALLGLAFKEGTDDLRSAPALDLARRFAAAGAEVVGFDPLIRRDPAGGRVRLASDPQEAVRGAHCVVVCTRWAGFRRLDLAAMRSLVAYPVIVDGRNVIDREAARRAGFTVHGMGRPDVGDGAELPGAIPV